MVSRTGARRRVGAGNILNGTVEPGKVFDRVIILGDVPDGFKAMDDRTAVKVLVRP